jgi:hypothetical protein
MKGDLLEALKLKYKAEMADAKARMRVYVNNPVGIGEHPQLTEELDKMVDEYTNAHDKLETIKKLESEL